MAKPTFTPMVNGGPDAARKARDFADLVRFLKAGCPRARFTPALYGLCNSIFGHIAHYSLSGYYDVWFAELPDRIRWAQHALSMRPCGDPTYTRSDVEEALQQWLKSETGRRMLFDWRTELNRAHDADEMATLRKLAAKHNLRLVSLRRL